MVCITKTVDVDVEIEVDLEDFEDDTLLKELQSRGVCTGELPPLCDEERHPMHEVFYALKAGDERRALEVTRSWLCDELGVVL